MNLDPLIVKLFLDMGTVGVLMICLYVVVRIMKAFHLEMRESESTRTAAVISALNDNIKNTKQIADVLAAASINLQVVTIEARELLREVKELRKERSS